MQSIIEQMKQQLQGEDYSFFYGYYNQQKIEVVVFAIQNFERIVILYKEDKEAENQIIIPYSQIRSTGIHSKKVSFMQRFFNVKPETHLKIELTDGRVITINDYAHETSEFGGDINDVYRILGESLKLPPKQKAQSQSANQEVTQETDFAVNFDNDRKQKALVWLNDANILFEKQLYTEAIKHYSLALDADPTNYEIYFNISKSYIKTDQNTKALDCFDKCIKLAPLFKQYMLKKDISNLLFDSGSYKEAYTLFESKNNTEDFVTTQKYLLASGDISETINTIIENIDNYPDTFKALIDDPLIPQEFIDQLSDKQNTIISAVTNNFKTIITPTSENIEFIKANSDNHKDVVLISNWDDDIAKLYSVTTVNKLIFLKDHLTSLASDIRRRKRILNQEDDATEIIRLLDENIENTEELIRLNDKLELAVTYIKNTKLVEENNEFLELYKEFSEQLKNNNLEKIEDAIGKCRQLIDLGISIDIKNEIVLKDIISKNLENGRLRKAAKINNELLKQNPDSSEYSDFKLEIVHRQRKRFKIVGSATSAAVAVIVIAIFIVPVMRQKIAWEQTQQSNTSIAYMKYLSLYPDNKNSIIAKQLGKEKLIVDSQKDSTIQLITKKNISAYLSDYIITLKTEQNNSAYEFIDIENDDIYELSVSYKTKEKYSAEILELYWYNFENNKFQIAYKGKCAIMEHNLIKQDLQKIVGNFHTCYTCYEKIPEPGIKTITLIYKNKKTLFSPTDPVINDKIEKNLMYLSSIQLPKNGDDGARKAYAVNLLAYYCNNHSIDATKTIFDKFYTSEDKETIWNEITELTKIYSFTGKPDNNTNIAKINSNQISDTTKATVKPLDPDVIVREFIEDLGSRKFFEAYKKTKNSAWPDYKWFSSVKAYGGINKTYIEEVKTEEILNDTAKIYADYYSYDSANKDGRFKQIFLLTKNNKHWKIVKVENKVEPEEIVK